MWGGGGGGDFLHFLPLDETLPLGNSNQGSMGVMVGHSMQKKQQGQQNFCRIWACGVGRYGEFTSQLRL